MKSNLLQILMMVSVLMGGSTSALAAENEFQFRFEMSVSKDLTTRTPATKTRFEYVTRADTYEDAFKIAAQACYRHFKDGKSLTEDQGLDIIDVCANPRRI
jgi:hypothetical protein